MKTILVTGAGTGIGLAIAQTLDAQGYALILMGRNEARLNNTKSQLNNPASHQVQACDIRDRSALDSALKNAGLDHLYGLVANAGVGGENQAGDADRWQEIVDTNLTGSYHTVQACLPYLKQNPDGGFRHIVIVSSILARLGVPGYTAYCASKAGLLGLMRSLASELAAEKILVNALCPGWVNTDMAHEGLQAFADILQTSKDEAYQQAMQAVPLGKMSEPEEVARYTAFLLSDAQTSITGQTLDINNGAMMP